MSGAATQIELISQSPEQTWRLGAALARQLAGGDVVALTGPLGAGKTQWVKGLAAGLGIDPAEVHSPTFTLVNEYSPAGGGLFLYHVDAYRLAGEADLDAIGFGELLAGRDGIVAVEWADRVAGLIEPGAVWIAGSMPALLSPNQRLYRVSSERADLIEALRNDQ